MTSEENGMQRTHIVTGASGYTGRYIAERLLRAGYGVRSLTGHLGRRNPFGGQVEMLPYRFDEPDELARSIEGADTLFNTYWIRMAHGEMSHDRAVENLRVLFSAAARAGVRRIVHVSITNATTDSPLPYFRGKALTEQALRDAGPSYAIIKPTLLFGRGDILLNNISWALRKFPIFPIPGSGEYPVQPGFVEDIADLAVIQSMADDNVEIDAVGPEIFSYSEYVELVRRSIGARCALLNVSPGMAMLGSKIVGALVRDVVLTRDEIDGLSSGLLVSKSPGPPSLPTGFTDWLASNSNELGRRYASEMDRHYR